MSEARKRLIRSVPIQALSSREAFVAALLSRPDDLIACLVESGALERYGESLRFGKDPIPLYRRTEGNTR